MARSDKTPPSEEPQEQPTLKQRVETAQYIAYGQHKLVTSEGEPDQEALIQKVFEIVKDAVVERPSERKKAVPRSQFMSQIFSKIPGKAEWIEQGDPELAEELYKKLDSDIWRVLNVDPGGPVQAKLNGEHSMLLCRVDANRNHEAHAYVTRNRKCLYEDYSAKARAAMKRVHDRHAALMAQAIDRVPEHAQAFMNEYNSAASDANAIGAGIVKGALAAGKAIPEDDGESEGK